MESKDLSLYATVEKPIAVFNKAYACVYFFGIICLIFYRIVYMPAKGIFPWNLVFGAELGFAFVWILDQAFRWRPVERRTFPERLSKRFEKELDPVDIFICTADPIKEPPINVINTVLSTLAFDYPVEKLSCYLSDDGGSPLTFYALLEASRFAKLWVPFCHKYSIEQRCPDAYFSDANSVLENQNLTFAKERENIMKLYSDMKYRIDTIVESGTVPEDECKLHEGFEEWRAGSSSQDHQSIVQILLNRGEDVDVEGHYLPNLVYVSREKRPGHPHNFKAGALNVLIRVSALMSNAPFILTLDCDMRVNNCKALRLAMCFLLDPETRHKLGFVQFPQRFHGITKNDIYANHLKRNMDIQFEGFDGNEGPMYIGTGCVLRRDVICGRDPRHGSSDLVEVSSRLSNLTMEKASRSNMADEAKTLANCSYEDKSLWGKQVGMMYGCAVEDVLTGFIIQCRGWKSVYCIPKRNAFEGLAPANLNDSLVQHKRWAAGHFEYFTSKYCPFVYGIGRVGVAQRMCYGFYCLGAPSCFHMICYGLVPALCLLSGRSLFPKISNPWFFVFAFLSLSASAYNAIEFLAVAGSFRSWWNEQRMWMLRGVSSYLFGMIQVMCKLMGLSQIGFEVTNKVTDSEAAKRYEAEIFEFGVASSMFVPPAVLAFINLIALLGGIAAVLRGGYVAAESLFVQLMLSSMIVISSYPIVEAMLIRKDKGRIPGRITGLSLAVAIVACSVALKFGI